MNVRKMSEKEVIHAEKEETHTKRNIAIGMGIGALATFLIVLFIVLLLFSGVKPELTHVDSYREEGLLPDEIYVDATIRNAGSSGDVEVTATIDCKPSGYHDSETRTVFLEEHYTKIVTFTFYVGEHISEAYEYTVKVRKAEK